MMPTSATRVAILAAMLAASLACELGSDCERTTWLQCSSLTEWCTAAELESGCTYEPKGNLWWKDLIPGINAGPDVPYCAHTPSIEVLYEYCTAWEARSFSSFRDPRHTVPSPPVGTDYDCYCGGPPPPLLAACPSRAAQLATDSCSVAACERRYTANQRIGIFSSLFGGRKLLRD